MLVYKTDKNYYVHLEEDGDNIWVNVLSEFCEEYFIVGSLDDNLATSDYIYSAYFSFHPANYVKEYLKNDFDRSAVLHVATTAFEIDRALEETYNAAKTSVN